MPTAFPGFSSEMPRFFRGLKRNNTREWFQPRKELFEQHIKQPMTELVEALNAQLGRFAPEYVTDPKKAIFRIYRDTRFSPDKTPYKTHMGAWFGRRGLASGAGYYFHVSHDSVFVGGGMYHPDPQTLLTERTHIAEHHARLRKILAQRKLAEFYQSLGGDELTRMPKGFDPQHPAADLIKKKDWVLGSELDPALATTPELYEETLGRFRAMLPFVEFLNQPLVGKSSIRGPLAVRL